MIVLPYDERLAMRAPDRTFRALFEEHRPEVDDPPAETIARIRRGTVRRERLRQPQRRAHRAP